MKKILIAAVFLFTAASLFSIERDSNLEKARRLSWDKDFEKSQELYKEILKEYKDLEVVLAYSDLLAWMGKYKEGIIFLKENYFDNDLYYLQLGKLYYWNKDYKNAMNVYKKSSKEDENSEKLKKWYSNFDKYELKYKYSSEFRGIGREEIPALYFTYKNYNKWTLVFSKEYYYKRIKEIEGNTEIKRSNLGNVVDLMELYYKNYYFAVGRSKYWDRLIAFEYTRKFLTLGIKDLDGALTYKIRTDNYYKNYLITNEINIPEIGDNYYKTELSYKKLKYSHIYDFKDINRGEIKCERQLKEKYILDYGLFRIFNKEISGFVIETAVKF